MEAHGSLLLVCCSAVPVGLQSHVEHGGEKKRATRRAVDTGQQGGYIRERRCLQDRSRGGREKESREKERQQRVVF